MNRHIIKRNVESDSPIVWCGRSIPANSDAVTLNQAALCSSIKVCKNCTKAAINALKPYGSFELDVDYPDELRSLADIQAIVDLRRENAELEKERDASLGALIQLKSEFVRCNQCGNQTECADFDIFNGGAVDWLLQAHNLEQQSKGIEFALENTHTPNVVHLKLKNLRNQAKALKESKDDKHKP